jgi:ABC-type dipeptide/oligopeptide/nickel transport system permease subunit
MALDQEPPIAVEASRPVADKARSQWAYAWQRFRRHRLACIGLAVCVLLMLTAAIAPLIVPYPPSAPDFNLTFQATGQHGHLLGTDELGRDTLSRLIYSLRTAFLVAFAAQALAVVLAVVVGMAAGYIGGRVDQGLMAVTDVMFAFPAYLFTIILVSVFGRGMLPIAFAIGISSWVTVARLMRAQALALKVRDYVEAGRAMGAGGVTITVRYILPNALGPLLIATSFGIPAAITAEAGLSLLGLGVQPPTPDLGAMISDGMQYVLSSPTLLIWSTVTFATIVLAFTWVGDGLRDAFDVGGE